MSFLWLVFSGICLLCVFAQIAWWMNTPERESRAELERRIQALEDALDAAQQREME